MALSRMKAARLRRRAEAREAKIDAVTRKLGGVVDEDATVPYDNLARASKRHAEMLDAMVYAHLTGKTGALTATP